MAYGPHEDPTGLGPTLRGIWLTSHMGLEDQKKKQQQRPTQVLLQLQEAIVRNCHLQSDPAMEGLQQLEEDTPKQGTLVTPS